MKKLIFVLSLLSSLSVFAESGILFIAHGTSNHSDHLVNTCTPHHYPEWERYVLNTINSVKGEMPLKYEVTFGMWESKCFDEAIFKLEARLNREGKTLDHLIVFPLFISSYSEVIEMQKYIFKKRPDRVIPLPHVHPTQFKGSISYLNALDYDPHVSMILANRFHKLIHLAKDQGFTTKQMELILVMHGPVDEAANVQWMKMGESYARDVMYLFPVAANHVISLRDDAPAEIRDRMTRELREKVSEARAQGRMALIVPLLVSKGGIDRRILERLKGLEYLWTGEALLPDPKLADVVVTRIKEVLK